MLKKNILSIFLLLVLTGCCKQKPSPQIIAINPATIIVEYYGFENFEEAFLVAKNYCNTNNRRAKILTTERKTFTILDNNKMHSEFMCLPNETTQKSHCGKNSYFKTNNY